MRPGDVQDLLGLLKGGTKTNTLTPEREAFWAEKMLGLDAELATQAVLEGVEHWEFFPSWAEFHGVYQTVMKRRQRAQEGAERKQAELEYDRAAARSKRGLAPWVKEWMVARFVVKPQDMRRFAEQGWERNPDDPLMPAGEHAELAAKMNDSQALTVLRKAAEAGAMVDEP